MDQEVQLLDCCARPQCCSKRTFQWCRQFSLCPFFSFILAGSPSHGMSNQRNQTSRPLKSSPSSFPSSANAPAKKLPVRQDNALASKTGKTYPKMYSTQVKCASFQKSTVHQRSVAWKDVHFPPRADLKHSGNHGRQQWRKGSVILNILGNSSLGSWHSQIGCLDFWICFRMADSVLCFHPSHSSADTLDLQVSSFWQSNLILFPYMAFSKSPVAYQQ